MVSDKSIDVVAGILWRGPQYLAVQRPEGKALAGWWEFPGGKVERGEDKAAALIRELAEELGVEAAAPHFWQSVHHGYASTAAHGQDGDLPPTAQAEGQTEAQVEGQTEAQAKGQAHLVAPSNTRHVHVHFYHVRAFNGEPRPCEGQTLRWVTPAEAIHLPFLAADVPIVERLHNAAGSAGKD